MVSSAPCRGRAGRRGTERVVRTGRSGLRSRAFTESFRARSRFPARAPRSRGLTHASVNRGSARWRRRTGPPPSRVARRQGRGTILVQLDRPRRERRFDAQPVRRGRQADDEGETTAVSRTEDRAMHGLTVGPFAHRVANNRQRQARPFAMNDRDHAGTVLRQRESTPSCSRAPRLDAVSARSCSRRPSDTKTRRSRRVATASSLWARGDERRYEEPELCRSLRPAIGITAIHRWEIEEDEG